MSSDQENNSGGNNSQEQNNTRQLRSNLRDIQDRVTDVQNVINSQTEVIAELNNVFININESISSSFNNMMSTTEQLTSLVQNMSVSIGQNLNQQVQQSFTDIANTASLGISNQAQMTQNLGNAMSQVASDVQTSSEQQVNGISDAVGAVHGLNDGVSELGDNVNTLSESFEELAEEAEELDASVKSLTGGLTDIIGSAFKGGAAIIGMAANIMTSLLSTVSKFVQLAVSIPFTISNAMVTIGNKLRQDIVEIIGMASEELKEKFDMNSTIGEGIMSMTNRGKGMLKAFQNPSTYLVKLFGLGAAGIANMIKELGTQLENMGQFSELFGKSLGNNQKLFEEYITMVRGLGLTAEDVGYLAMDASNNMMHINDRMRKLTATVSNTAEYYDLDRKRLSKNFMTIRKDITLFGHLTDQEIADTTARMTQMKIKMEDAAAVFNKFSTFEDAANSVAMLSQTFGMNLNAMDMIKAKKPEDIIEMFRNSMYETGRSFQDLNRFEKDLMAQHTGMSAESLSALMNYRDMGLTYEQARKKMEEQRPEAKQMAAIKDLNSAMKQFQKILTFESPFQAFMDGIMNNMTLTGDLKNVVVSLSNGYQGIYEFAANLKTTEWYEIARPIKLVIDIMSSIFKSEEFRKGLQTGLETISVFVSSAFGVSTGERALSGLEVKMKSAMSKGGILNAKSKDKGVIKYREEMVEVFKNVDKGIMTKFTAAGAIAAEEISNITTPEGMLVALKKLEDAAQKNPALKSSLDQVMVLLSAGINQIPEKLRNDLSEKTIKNGSKQAKTISVEAFKSTTEEITAHIDKMMTTNSENLGNLTDLVRRISGALIKGGAIGATVALKLINRGIGAAKTEYDKQGKEFNAIESFLKFKPGELSAIGQQLGDAFTEFMSNSSAIASLSGWLISGFTGIFGTVLGNFLFVLKDKLVEYFPNIFNSSGVSKETNVNAMAKSRADTVSPSRAIAAAELQQSATEGKISARTGADLITSFNRKAAAMSGGSEKNQLVNVSRALDANFREGFSSKKHKGMTSAMKNLLSSINEEGKFIGNKETLTKLLGILNSQKYTSEEKMDMLFGSKEVRVKALKTNIHKFGSGITKENEVSVQSFKNKNKNISSSSSYDLQSLQKENLKVQQQRSAFIEKQSEEGLLVGDLNKFSTLEELSGALKNIKDKEVPGNKNVDSYINNLLLERTGKQQKQFKSSLFNNQEIYKLIKQASSGEAADIEILKGQLNNLNTQLFGTDLPPLADNNKKEVVTLSETSTGDIGFFDKINLLPKAVQNIMKGIDFQSNLKDVFVNSNFEFKYDQLSSSVSDFMSSLGNLAQEGQAFKQASFGEQMTNDAMALPDFDVELVRSDVEINNLYKDALILNAKSNNKITKKKVAEAVAKLGEVKKSLENQSYDIDAKLVLGDNVIIDLLAEKLKGPLVAKNLGRTFTDPRYTQGVMGIKEDAFMSPTANVGSDFRTPTSKV